MTRAPTLSREQQECLSRYHDLESTAEEAAAAEALLAAVPQAGAYLNDIKMLSNELRCDDTDQRAAATIRAELRRRLRGRTPARVQAARRWTWTSLIGALALAAVLTLQVPFPWRGSSASTGSTITFETVAQQYTLALDALGRPTP